MATDTKVIRDHVPHPIIRAKRNAGIVVHHPATARTATHSTAPGVDNDPWRNE
jgi:hypothetical protein